MDNQGLDIVESKSTIESELKLFLRKKIVGPKFLELTKLWDGDWACIRMRLGQENFNNIYLLIEF